MTETKEKSVRTTDNIEKVREACEITSSASGNSSGEKMEHA